MKLKVSVVASEPKALGSWESFWMQFKIQRVPLKCPQSISFPLCKFHDICFCLFFPICIASYLLLFTPTQLLYIITLLLILSSSCSLLLPFPSFFSDSFLPTCHPPPPRNFIIPSLYWCSCKNKTWLWLICWQSLRGPHVVEHLHRGHMWLIEPGENFVRLAIMTGSHSW